MDIVTVTGAATVTAITIVTEPAMTATTGDMTVMIEEGTATSVACL
jgi:hypothetical protein